MPDLPGARVLGPAVFELSSFGEMHDSLEALEPGLGAASLSGGSTRDYAARHGAASLICELPLWTDSRAADTRASEVEFAELMRRSAVELRAIASTFDRLLARSSGRLNTASPFYRAVADIPPLLSAMAEGKDLELAAAGNRRASNAEVFMELQGVPDTLRLRLGGTLLRLIEDSAPSPERDAVRDDISKRFDRWAKEIESERPGLPVPIPDLIGIQSAAILVAAERTRIRQPC